MYLNIKEIISAQNLRFKFRMAFEAPFVPQELKMC